MSLGDNLRRLRREKGLTQYQLGEKTGMKVGHISKLEADGADPKLSSLYKLMEGLGCSADALLLDTDRLKTDDLLRIALERAMALPEANKVHLIDVVDHYCIACGIEQMLNPENKRWFEPNWLILPQATKPLINREEASQDAPQAAS